MSTVNKKPEAMMDASPSGWPLGGILSRSFFLFDTP